MLDVDEDPEDIAGVADADLSGQTVLVTGSTNGLGREAALALGRLGAEVVVHGRDEAAGESAVTALEAAGTEAHFLPADFESVDAVRSLAARVTETVGELDALCNNAGGLFDDAAQTDLGVERTFHINHLSPYLLTAELLDRAALAADARVVTTSSIGHRVATMNLDSLIEATNFSPWAAYCRSKLANLRFSNELARRLDAHDHAITSNAFHPGIVPGSEFSRALPGPVQWLGDALDEVPLTDSPEDGAATICYLVASDEVAGVSGKYFARCRQRRPDPAAADLNAQRDLWRQSANLLDIEEPLPLDE